MRGGVGRVCKNWRKGLMKADQPRFLRRIEPPSYHQSREGHARSHARTHTHTHTHTHLGGSFHLAAIAAKRSREAWLRFGSKVGVSS